MTRSEAEELFSTCTAIVDVVGGDLRQLCRNRGIPEHYIEEFVKRSSRSDVYDDFFSAHSEGGDINLNESELVSKLKNFGIQAGVDKKGKKSNTGSKEQDIEFSGTEPVQHTAAEARLQSVAAEAEKFLS